ncbi:MAG: ribulose-phosphate 3-epimerase [Bifidobacteriaceae bacterium]|jgi:ribulose-phosphate 3-epimerase|nr:ribulose-phosphate 3-epimerase [Bifidobacteriaceae bacterium]
MPLRFAPSILSADFANLERELGRIASADLVHVDVMDQHFVPNLTIGLPVLRRLAQVSPLPIDAHLMIEDPDRWAPAYADAGAASVTFHAEAAKAPVRLARELRREGVKVGVAINPGTPVASVVDLLGEIDMLLVMSVEPGFGGQTFIERTLAKVAQARALLETTGLAVDIQVDGGVDPTTVRGVADAGATVLVAGAAVFATPDPAAALANLRALATAQEAGR